MKYKLLIYKREIRNLIDGKNVKSLRYYSKLMKEMSDMYLLLASDYRYDEAGRWSVENWRLKIATLIHFGRNAFIPMGCWNVAKTYEDAMALAEVYDVPNNKKPHVSRKEVYPMLNYQKSDNHETV